MGEKLFNVGIKSIIIKDDRVLILKNAKGFWDVPGGRIDANEDISQTLNRELREELLNIGTMQIGKLLAVSRLPKDIKPDVSLVFIFYRVEADFTGDPQLSDEHLEWKWATEKEALDVIFDGCKEAISIAFED